MFYRCALYILEYVTATLLDGTGLTPHHLFEDMLPYRDTAFIKSPQWTASPVNKASDSSWQLSQSCKKQIFVDLYTISGETIR